VCTREYYPSGQLALTVGGERDFARIGRDALRTFAKAAEISARRTEVLAGEVVAAIHDAWPSFKPSIENAALEDALEQSFSAVPLMSERGRGRSIS
jgi:hypothetical protein